MSKPYYSVTATASAGGTVTLGSAGVSHAEVTESVMWGRGTTVSFTANEGYELKSVTVNGVDKTAEVVDDVLVLNDIRDNIVVVATFQKLCFAITTTAGEGGSITLSSEQTEWGDDVMVTIVHDEDYELATLTINGTDVTVEVVNQQYVIHDVRSNVEVAATFCSTVAFVTIPASGMMTYCSDHDLDFSGVAGVKAYIASGLIRQTASVMMMRVNDVPAGTGLVIKGKPGTYKIPYAESTAYYMNMLRGNKETNSATIQLPEGYSEELHFVFGADGKKGDVNDDGVVNEVDAQMVLDYSVAKEKPW